MATLTKTLLLLVTNYRRLLTVQILLQQIYSQGVLGALLEVPDFVFHFAESSTGS